MNWVGIMCWITDDFTWDMKWGVGKRMELRYKFDRTTGLYHECANWVL